MSLLRTAICASLAFSSQLAVAKDNNESFDFKRFSDTYFNTRDVDFISAERFYFGLAAGQSSFADNNKYLDNDYYTYEDKSPAVFQLELGYKLNQYLAFDINYQQLAIMV